VAASQVVDHVVDEGQQLGDQVDRRHLLLLAEVDQLAADAIARRPPFVLVEQQPAIEAKAQVLLDQPVELGHHRLDQRGERDGLVDPHRHVADAELERVEVRVHADVPPDHLAVVDAVGLDQQLDVVVVLRQALEVVRDAGARKAVEDLLR